MKLIKQTNLDHKFVERTLDTCERCFDSRRLEKHAVIAIGLKVTS